MSVYFFYGDEDYNIELEIQKLKKKLLDKNFSAMNFRSYDNPTFADLIAILRSQPMMFGNLMVVISVEDYFSRALEDKQLAEIEDALNSNTESLCVILTVALPRNENKKLDTRKKIYKIISKCAIVQEFPTFKSYKIDEIVLWLNKEAKKHDISLEKEAALALIEQVGNNLRELSGELEKLRLLAYPQTVVTKAMVREICISNEDLFAFIDFLLKGDRGHALAEFKKLLEKDHPLKILSALQTMLRSYITIKLKSSECSLFEISKLVGQHEYRVKLTLEKMKNTPLKDLVTLKQNLIEAEFRIKSGQSFNVEAEVENALLKVE